MTVPSKHEEWRARAEEALEIEAGTRCGFCALPIATSEDWKRCDASADTPELRGEGLCWNERDGLCPDGPLPHQAVLASAVVELIAENERLPKEESMPDVWEERFKALVREVQEIDQGVHPAAWAGKYEKRTERMEGWNDAVMDCIEKIGKAVKRASAHIDEDRALLLASDCTFVHGDKLAVNLNDTLGWACADAEEIPSDKIKEVADLFRSWGHKGLIYWACKQRGWEQSEFKDINRFVDFIRREEEWKAQEPSSAKRAYADIPREGKEAP